MQIYTENRFCLPLFYLIVLGVALSIWICPDKAFATGASSGVHDDHPRAGSRRAAPFPWPGGFPRILSGYAFQMPGSRPAADP